MTETIAAIYEKGAFRLVQPIELPEGTNVEIIVIPKPSAQKRSPTDILGEIAALPLENNADRVVRYPSRREFIKLPIEERRHILAEQADGMLGHYQTDREWQELEAGELIDY